MDQPLCNWSDKTCFRVSVRYEEKKRSSLLVVPFCTHLAALAAKPEATRAAVDLDPRGPFYAYGTCRHENGHPTGALNARLEPNHPKINRGACN